ncbi:helix-turn-helix domain-containing protein [Streptomyces sp. NPDC004539]|uniref:TetR/AcrR family transcriptional regulator n=1 Tax=Streptomyces sp. NPDC004539 TaxID=3154280 RepID=UPI0033B841E8
MPADTSSRNQAVAARNSARILRAAREVFARRGPQAMLEEIAREAGVGIATLYRHFPSKEQLVQAALRQAVTEELDPAITAALGDDDPKHGLATLLEATLTMAAREQNTLAAAGNSGVLTAEATAPFLDALALLTRRGQQAGTLRADVVPDDLHRIMGMLVSVLWSNEPGSANWRRYVTLLLDSLSPLGATPLPPLLPGTKCRQGTPSSPETEGNDTSL